MIKALRVDERLVHGQIAMVWSKELKCGENGTGRQKANHEVCDADGLRNWGIEGIS